MSPIQKSTPQSEQFALATCQHFGLSLAFVLQPYIEMVLLNHDIKPEGEAGETPGFSITRLSEYASVLVPCYWGCQAHLKMAILEGQVQSEAM